MPEKFLTKIKIVKALSEGLPGVKSHLKMIPEGRHLKVDPENKKPVKKSSVLILLYPENYTLYCILIKRPETMKHHAGQLAFPGGMIEKTDFSPWMAALREAQEEVGLISDSVDFIGELSPLYVAVSHFSISPFIGWCESSPKLKSNPLEVVKIIRFPVTDFFNKVKRDLIERKTFTGPLKVPCFLYQDEVIWGATAMILSELFDVLCKIPVREGLH